MNVFAEKAAEIEMNFLDGVETNLVQAVPQYFSATGWTTRHPSQDERVRNAMRDSGLTDRDALVKLPRNRSVVMTGTRRRFIFGKKVVAVAGAMVLSPVEHLLREDGSPQPIGSRELKAQIESFIRDRGKVPCVLGICSTSGFEAEVLRSMSVPPNVTLVLVTQRDDGGWGLQAVGDHVDDRLVQWFDPEVIQQKIDRVHRAVEVYGDQLFSSGVSSASLADDLQLPEKLVHLALKQLAKGDPSLTVTRQGEDVILYRTTATDSETSSMSMSDRIRNLFGLTGEETRKINELTERRVQLAQRRDRMYDDIAKFEKRETELVDKGREASTDTAKRRVVPQIKTVRNEIQRHTATARMLDRQIDIINTDIHNLTMIQQGKQAKLPTTDELTDHAVQAEEMLEQLAGDADLTESLAAGVDDLAMSEEDTDILAELNIAPAPKEASNVSSAASEPVASEDTVSEESPSTDKASESDRPEPEAG